MESSIMEVNVYIFSIFKKRIIWNLFIIYLFIIYL